MIRTILLSLCLIVAFSTNAQRPNIIWVMAEDISTDLASYGMAAVHTPFLDQLAKEGTLYENAFCTAPSCTPSRNAMLTGAYQTSTDTQDQRRGGVQLPEGMHAFTKLLREAGYYTALGCGYHDKTDHNFVADKYKTAENAAANNYLFDGRDWSEREEGQPFFAQITLPITHRWYSEQWPGLRASSKNPVDTSEVVLPPYFPRHPVSVEDWTLYLEAIGKMDQQMGEILHRLDEEGIADNTVIIFIGDNGRCHLRGKCWLYDAGIQVPLIIRWPGKIAPGTKNQDLVSMLDITAGILDIAGAGRPEYLAGQSIFDPSTKPREYVFAARDMIGEVMDHIRCVRTKDFKYIRNYTPENGYYECQYVQDNRPMLAVMQEMYKVNQLTPAQSLLLAETKPVEELYDLKNDPHELHNLVELPEYQKELKKLRKAMDRWIEETGDTGLDGDQETDYLAELKEDLKLKWPNNRTINIVFHGHSVPSGYFTGGRVHTLAAYPHLFLKFLKEKYPTAVINSITTSIGGEQSEQGAKRFRSDVLPLKPDLIFIDYALNDRSIGLERTEKAWRSMIEVAMATGIKTVLLTPTPDLTEDILDEKAKLVGHVELIKKMGKEYRLPVVDVYSRFKALKASGADLAAYMSQSNHPNERGHEIVLSEIVELLFKE